jgi:ketosteroid isomerase-like protein
MSRLIGTARALIVGAIACASAPMAAYGQCIMFNQPEELFARSSAVFEGTVIATAPTGAQGSHVMVAVVTLRVERSWKGVRSGEIRVSTDEPLALQKKYLVFASGEPLSTSVLCRATEPIGEARLKLEWLSKQPAPSLTTPDAATESELRALRQKLFDGLKRGDKAVLEELLADGFVFIHSTGVLERRADFIARSVAAAQAAAPNDVEFLEDDIRVYNGDTVVWITESRRRGPPSAPELNFRGTDVLVKTGSRWQWVSVHSTRLPAQ